MIKANNEKDKTLGLKELRDQLEQLLVLIRIAKEVKAFKSFAAYQYVVENTAKVCRQNEGWLKSMAEKSTRSRRTRAWIMLYVGRVSASVTRHSKSISVLM